MILINHMHINAILLFFLPINNVNGQTKKITADVNQLTAT